MHIAFESVAMVGFLYFLLAKRRFDFLTVAYGSAAIYILPGFFGFVIYPRANQTLYPSAIIDETYAIMLAVLLALALTAILCDRLGSLKPPRIRFVGANRAAEVAGLCSLIGICGAVATSGGSLLSLDKFELLSELNRWYVLGSSALPLFAVFSFERKKWRLFSCALLGLAADMFIGFRANTAITAIALLTLVLSQNSNRGRLIGHRNVLLAGATLAIVFLAYKGLILPIKTGDWSNVTAVLVSPDWYSDSFTHSEPFVTQAILNETLCQDFSVGMAHFTNVLFLFVPFATEYSSDVLSFNDLFQPILFPGSETWMGMANNIWAEAWSSGGYPLFAIFLLIFLSLLVFGSSLLRSLDPEVRAGVAIGFSWLAFYVHRNDVLYLGTLERRTFTLWLTSIFVSMALVLVVKVPRTTSSGAAQR